MTMILTSPEHAFRAFPQVSDMPTLGHPPARSPRASMTHSGGNHLEVRLLKGDVDANRSKERRDRLLEASSLNALQQVGTEVDVLGHNEPPCSSLGTTRSACTTRSMRSATYSRQQRHSDA